jgi:hypothetical protein
MVHDIQLVSEGKTMALVRYAKVGLESFHVGY